MTKVVCNFDARTRAATTLWDARSDRIVLRLQTAKIQRAATVARPLLCEAR